MHSTSGNDRIILIQASESFLYKLEEGFRMLKEIQKILDAINTMQEPQFYSPQEFMKKAKIGRNKFEELKPRLNINRSSPRKYSIPHSDLVRWFSGDLY
jgi:hypothetical protein